MADRTAEVLFNETGQTVSVYPPEAILGIPSSVTCDVFEGGASDDDTAEFSPTVTVDAVSTTLSAAAGYSQSDRTLLTVASVTGMDPGTLYLVDNVSEQKEIVEPKAVPASGGAVLLAHPLELDYPITTSTVKGIKMTFTVDPTWVAAESNILAPWTASYKVKWKYTIAGVVRRYTSYLRLVRKQFKSGITQEDLTTRWPDMRYHEPVDRRGNEMRWLIKAAEDVFRVDLLAQGFRPEQISDTEIVARNMVPLCLWVFTQATGAAPGRIEQERYQRDTRAEYDGVFNATIATLKAGIDEGAEGATSAEPMQQMFWKR